jgi:GGDEF domain-containing protein
MDESQEKALADVLPAAKAASEIIRGVMRHRHFLAGVGKDDLYFRMIRAESALQDLVNGCEACLMSTLKQREAIFERLRKALQAPTEAEGGLTARQEITLGKAEDAYIQDRLEDADRMLTHLGY